ncbi:response regulator [Phaeovulum vinaykumarii]|uniref:Response regulator receiver domain-containing protein n=1 Tax=Phaeovulum vinaykumarii TaxID=407234 RepID=A0A1N7KCT8_9RHOB|nr:response regulator [Phaeovulum vinaykumarii]SIS59391.1 Response regulator receiver domain-containing protein [Phaeovulum vinaykumarii]SOB94106.1 response regulator receiver domain-containing protein [Phaeovulum vinaykumarii]
MGDDPILAGAYPVPSNRPLVGLTVLVVEDSRFACEAMRLLCLRSGARIRRADCLRSARRHLQVYRPGVVIVDLGLPDGSGVDLIDELTHAPVRVPVILGASGDPDGREAALAAGADGFLAKPVESLMAFQKAIISALPTEQTPLRAVATPAEDAISPDPLALRDDLSHVADVLSGAPDGSVLDYVAQFLGGVARSARDEDLAAAAAHLARSRQTGNTHAQEVERLRGLVDQRLSTGAVI